MQRSNLTVTAPQKDPLWYKQGVIYQVHARAYYDSDGNGIGDFRGLTEKLDYLQDLGVTALWLLPFYPSPLKDDGYDIADYYDINPIYGTLGDFKVFLREAHARGLRVITELVINHTSDQHPWFQQSRRAKPGTKWREFYVWSDTPETYKDARIIFKDFEPSNWTWDRLANAYFWHRFYSHQPDLNFDNPLVHAEILRVLDFWMGLGVDGVRLDAVPYLYEREGTNCENLPETHAFLKKLRRHVDEKYGDRMLLAEANQWPEDAVTYFGAGQGDECHMAFHFPVMPRLFMAVRMEDRIPIVDILEQTPPIPETSQWAVFLRNHDELTLEMVTDEERDYMYRVYAHDAKARLNLGIRRRLAPLLGSDRKRIELLNGLLLSLPGTPVIYYGDELGMGDNVFLGDRNGVRTPMHWSSDKNAGFSRANPQGLYLPIILDPEYHYEAINVEAQERNPHSLLWWMRRVIALRKKWRAFGQGTLEFLHPANRKIFAYVRRFQEECILVVANLSRFVQPVELDLAAFPGCVPVELFGRTEFPRVTERPYFLTLAPHSFFWFSLEPAARLERKALTLPSRLEELRLLTVPSHWAEVVEEGRKAQLENVLPDYLKPRRWFGGKARGIKSLSVVEAVPVPYDTDKAFLLLLQVEYVEGDPDVYTLPVAFAAGDAAQRLMAEYPQLAIARLEVTAPNLAGILYDAMGHKPFCAALLAAITKRRSFRGAGGDLEASHTSMLRQVRGEATLPLEPAIAKAEHSNTAVLYGDRMILKLFRRLDVGTNPDLEVCRFLTAKKFRHVPPLLGAIEYRRSETEVRTVAILHAFVPNAKDAWEYTLDALSRYYERVIALMAEGREVPAIAGTLADAVKSELPSAVPELLGTYIESARLLGERTAALHLALASDAEKPDFAPEPFTPHYQRSIYQSMRHRAKQNLVLLRSMLKGLPADVAPLAEKVAALEPDIQKRFRALLDRRITAQRIRCHGDYHLGQVLYTGKDFIILDFEGEPAVPLSERRIKRSPMRDVAGMLRSFHYAAYAALYQQLERGRITTENLPRHEAWARFWHRWVSVVFLKAYLKTAGAAAFLPKASEEFQLLLDTYLLNKAVYELGYELNNRPAWLKIPCQGILQLVGTEA
jgi:maltose alpha-D-glucosyltransferase/alpha-amylase